MATLTKSQTGVVVYACANTSIATPTGRIIRLERGEPWDANDPVVVQRPDMFSQFPIVRSVDGWKRLD